MPGTPHTEKPKDNTAEKNKENPVVKETEKIAKHDDPGERTGQPANWGIPKDAPHPNPPKK